jgi:hypothetical protein
MYTDHKIREAEYFWSCAKNSQARSEIEAFNYSAFFSAFRSATFVLQAEYKHTEGFVDVYGELQKALADSQVFSELKEARNTVLKEGAKVPTFLITTTDDKTGDEMTTEVEPAGFNAGTDLVFSLSYKFGPNRGNFYPPDTPREERDALVLMALFEATQGFNYAHTQRKVFIRVRPGGTLFEIDEFHLQVGNGINMIRLCAERLRRIKYPKLSTQP